MEVVDRQWEVTCIGYVFISDTIDKVSMSAIVMDIDSTTVAEIRKSAAHEVIKESENKSCERSVGNVVYALQKKHDILSLEIVPYLQKCFS